MSFNKIDSSHDFAYPTSPDARGSTRVNHKRRPYYLGPHDSPLSYIMFGLWKHRLQETGEPPSTREIRALAEELLTRVTAARSHRRTYWTQPRTIAAAIAGALLCMTIGFMIVSSRSPAKVDDTLLSESEADVIRTIRMRRSMTKEMASGQHDSVAELTSRLIAEGISNGARHVATSDL